MRFIPFALKDDAKKWMYYFKVGSIIFWDYFVDIFLKRYFPTSKTIRLRNETLSSVQLEHELFWRYMNVFKEFFAMPISWLER